MLAHDEDFGGGNFFAKQSSRIESIQTGHAYVEKDKVGKNFSRDLNRLFAAFGFTANFPRGHGSQNALYTTAHPFIVIGKQNSH